MLENDLDSIKKRLEDLENGDRLAGEGSYSTISSNCGVPGGIRTHDPLLRRQPLCPTELQGQYLLLKCSTRRRERSRLRPISAPLP